MVELRSPCLECELKDQDKRNPTCRDCEKRVKYCAALGGMTHSVPDSVSLDGEGGTRGLVIDDCRLSIVDESDEMEQEQIQQEESVTDNVEQTKTKTCNRADCTHGGQSQPLDDFDRSSTAKDGHHGHCKDCRRRLQRRSRKKRKLAQKDVAQSATKTADKPEGVIVPAETQLTIDFGQHPDVLKKIKEIAKDEIREPENQVLFWLKEYSQLLADGDPLIVD